MANRRRQSCRIYSCQSCEQEFGRRSDLREHRKTDHVRITGPYNCPICQKVSPRKHEILQHIRSHYQCYPFASPMCNARLKWKNSVTRHSCIWKMARAFGTSTLAMAKMVIKQQVVAKVTDPTCEKSCLVTPDPYLGIFRQESSTCIKHRLLFCAVIWK